ncbi:putative potassium transport system protein kup 1 [Hypericibacter terrae]|uniref:Probable potassium transport system protein Kup n=1 Tax=Hypericibacter terrae TaxID=2602015 RepID=A0A5J6MR65_9PROT|nr:potassium transporter Kup [Hypericibacter terrae]QEX19691.1 putative potassium transport system protein kup 1 [Hypericibacter terrae]
MSAGGETVTQKPARHSALVIGALGIVYGDIGTSPIYAFRESLAAAPGTQSWPETVLGVASLTLWVLIIVVTIKYVLLIMRADNRGEGGILSLAALALRLKSPRGRRLLMVSLAIIGVALFYGDGLITPAISVLSAVEGLEVIAPSFQPYVVPCAVAILVGLFMIQSHGTALVGRLFGPIMVVWFSVLAILGIINIAEEPGVLRAIDPVYGLTLLAAGGWKALAILGAVVLTVTGAEALYADMGHFGRSPIRAAWLRFVLPALALNYLGQASLVLRNPDAASDPFFLQAPAWGLIPLVVLATIATVIASQAVISGSFSLTRQAIQLDYVPRMEVRHTSATEIGQIYMPRVNWILMIGVLTLVLGFGSSNNLAGAYGIAVTGTMSATTILAAIVARYLWNWHWLVVGPLFGALLGIDLLFFGSTLLKIPNGGWFPLLAGGTAIFVMATWRRGRKVVYDKLYGEGLKLDSFLARLEASPMRIARTAIFMTGDPTVVPRAMLHNMKHNMVLHERNVLLRVIIEDLPHVPADQRVAVERLGKGFFRVIVRYGYMQDPNVPAALEAARKQGLATDMMTTSFFIGRETMIPSSKPGLPFWQERLFIALAATALNATAFFDIPPGQVVEMGAQVEI